MSEKKFPPRIWTREKPHEGKMFCSTIPGRAPFFGEEFIHIEEHLHLLREAKAEAFEESIKLTDKLANKLDKAYSHHCSCFSEVSWLSNDLEILADALRAGEDTDKKESGG